MNSLSVLSRLLLALGVVAFLATAGLSTGAFTTADVERIAGVRIGGTGSTLVSLDVADEVSVACSQELVTVTNNFDSHAEFVVSIPEDRDGVPAASEDADGEDPLRFTLAPGESRTVYVTDVQGPVQDDLEFTVTASTDDTSVTLTEHVDKVPGNHDHFWGHSHYDDCGDDRNDPDGDDGHDHH